MSVATLRQQPGHLRPGTHSEQLCATVCERGRLARSAAAAVAAPSRPLWPVLGRLIAAQLGAAAAGASHDPGDDPSGRPPDGTRAGSAEVRSAVAFLPSAIPTLNLQFNAAPLLRETTRGASTGCVPLVCHACTALPPLRVPRHAAGPPARFAAPPPTQTRWSSTRAGEAPARLARLVSPATVSSSRRMRRPRGRVAHRPGLSKAERHTTGAATLLSYITFHSDVTLCSVSSVYKCLTPSGHTVALKVYDKKRMQPKVRHTNTERHAHTHSKHTPCTTHARSRAMGTSAGTLVHLPTPLRADPAASPAPCSLANHPP